METCVDCVLLLFDFDALLRSNLNPASSSASIFSLEHFIVPPFRPSVVGKCAQLRIFFATEWDVAAAASASASTAIPGPENAP